MEGDILMFKKIKIFKKIRKIKKTKPAFIVLDKDFISYYDEFASLTLELPEDIVQDLEVINKGKLFETIRAFIENNQLTPKKALMVLSPSLFFEKSFKDMVDIETQTAMFLENVPFENISSRLMVYENESKLLATNIDFFTPIKNVFESEGFTVNLVLPYLALKKLKFDIKKVFETKTNKEFNQKLKLLKKNNLLTEISGSEPKKRIKSFIVKIFKIKNKRLAFLLSVFLMLVFILVVLVVSNNTLSKFQLEQSQVLEKNLPLTASSQNSAVVPVKTLENTTIKISYNDDRLKIAKMFKDQLTQQGFKNISLENENIQSNTSKTFVVFSLKFPKALKEKIVTEVNKTFIDVTIQDSNEIQSDVLITVGQAY
jgi:hypothetical protein